MPINENAKLATLRFIELGWRPHQAFAIVGNDYQESLLEPQIVGDKKLEHPAHGIGQWRGERFANLQLFAAPRPWFDLQAQIEFQHAELTDEKWDILTKRAGDRLKAATNLEDATAAAIGAFRPRGYKVGNPKAGHGWKNRLKNAHDLEAWYMAREPVAAPSVSLPVPALASTRLYPPPLTMGSQGPAVTLLQQKLAALGYKLSGTGYFGPATDTAVKDYQRRRGLDVDGDVGEQTAGALERNAPEVKPAKVPTSTPLWFSYGLTLLNVEETPGSGDTLAILQWAKAEGGSIAKNYKDDGIPWCALYWNHCLTKAGMKGTETLWALDANSDKLWPNVKLAGPAVGATFTMKRTAGGHIGFVAGRDQHGNLMILGGNQNDEVSIRPFPESKALSYRWPLGGSLPRLTGFAYLPIINSTGAAVKVT